MNTQEVSPSRGIPIVKGLGMQTIPDRAVGVTVTGSASTNTYGNYTQISAGEPWALYIYGIMLGPSTAYSSDCSYWQMQLALGAASSEINISSFKLFSVDVTTGTAGKNNMQPFWLPFPLFVPAWSRIAARAAAPTGSIAQTVSLNIVKADDLEVLD